MKEKIYNLLRSGDETNIKLAWELDKSQGLGIKEKLTKGLKPLMSESANPLTSGYTYVEEFFIESHIYIDDLNLTEIPKEFECLKHISGLYVNDNKLNNTPNFVCDFKNLVNLVGAYNKITSLPKNIGRLVNLTYMNFLENTLSSLPQSFSKLKGLRMLDLRANKFTSVPEPIKKLTGLKHLYLTGNPIPQAEIDELRNILPNCEINF